MIPKHLLVLKHLKTTLYAKSFVQITLTKEDLLLPDAQLTLGCAHSFAC